MTHNKLREGGAPTAKREAHDEARKPSPLHGYKVEMGEEPDHAKPCACVIVAEDTIFRRECLELYRRRRAEGRSHEYCEDAVSDSLGEWEVEWAMAQDGRALEKDAFQSTIAMVAPDVEAAKKRLVELFTEDPDRWRNLCGWPRFTIYEKAPRAPF